MPKYLEPSHSEIMSDADALSSDMQDVIDADAEYRKQQEQVYTRRYGDRAWIVRKIRTFVVRFLALVPLAIWAAMMYFFREPEVIIIHDIARPGIFTGQASTGQVITRQSSLPITWIK